MPSIRVPNRVINAPYWVLNDHFLLLSRIVGTVSQSGGVPTGALFEYGDNANGKYLRFADGTQICWTASATITTDNIGGGQVWASPTIIFTFPAAFAAAPRLASSVSWASGGTVYGAQFGGRTGTSVNARLISNGATNQGWIDLIAIGRWF